MGTIRTILYPLEFSDEGRAGLRGAAELAAQYGATLVVGHVSRRPLLWGGAEAAVEFQPSPDWEPNVEEIEKRIQELVDAEVPPAVPVRWRVASGPVSRTLAELAEAEDADLIVVPTHAHRSWREALAGISPEKVVHYASRPVHTLLVAEP